MDDEQILSMLEQRDERALDEIRSKYGKSCRTIAYNLLGNSLDAEEVISDTLMQTWNAIPPAHPENLFAFLASLTKRISMNRYKYEHAVKRGGRADRAAALDELSECIPSHLDVEQKVEQRQLSEAINRFLAGQPPEARSILVQRYFMLHSVREIADAYQISESKVKITLHRMRKKLRKFLEQEEWL